MASTLGRPRLSKNQQNGQLSYELPHRVHAVKAYPIRSSNGSTIIIYGHENGVRIIWRGGTPFKPSEEGSTAPKKTNGAKNAVVLLDSDDEGTSGEKFGDKPTFADEEDFDPSRPYPAIIQDIDLYLGTDALHIALLPASVLKSDRPSRPGLENLTQKIVFAVSCADNNVRLITLPITPPSPASKARPDFRSNSTLANTGNGSWGETVVTLSGHQKTSDGVAITVDSSPTTEKPGSKSSGARIIVASHSQEVKGLLLLWRLPITPAHAQIEPFQNIYLISPAKSISFNPSLSSHHCSQLLVAESAGPCRIYNYKVLSRPPSADPDTLPSEQGSWLLSLYPGFHNSKNDPPVGARAGIGRKPLVDAQWVAGGNGILALLNDGEFGIWDIEGVGPGASQGLLGRQGITGASISPFSAKGYIETRLRTKVSGQPLPSTSKGFAPMTPGTRKSTTPFGPQGTSTPLCGQISVLEVPSTSSTNPSDETVFFWLGDNFALIANLSKFWAANSRKGGTGNLFASSTNSSSGILKLDGVELKGERCSGIELIPKAPASSNGLPAEMLILGEHRFTILNTSSNQQQRNKPATSRTALVERNENASALANAGELDIMGIEQALTRMENGRTKKLFG